MARHGSLEKTHTNRIRMTLTLAGTSKEREISRKSKKLLEWFLENNNNLILHKLTNFIHKTVFA